jgi:hypothetical protein
MLPGRVSGASGLRHACVPSRLPPFAEGSRLLVPSLLVVATTLGCAAPVIPVRTMVLLDGPLVLPMVDAEVGDGRLPLLLDSGTDDHFVEAAVGWGFGVDALGLDGSASDATGASVAADLARPGALHVPGLSDERLEPLVIVYSTSLRGIGVLGAVSPRQLVGPGERAVVDFRAGRMTILPEDEGRLPAAGEGRAAGTLERCRFGDGDERDGRWVVRAAIGGRDVRLTVDTGAGRTMLFDDAAVGRELVEDAPPEETAQVAGGEPGGVPATGENPRIVREREAWVGGLVDVLAVPDVPVGVGELTWTITVSVAARGVSPECGVDGVLGFDILRYCVLSFGPEDGEWSCSMDPPRAPEPAGPSPGGPVRIVAVEVGAGCGLTAGELQPGLEPGTLPATFPSLLDALAPLYGAAESYARWVVYRCEGNGYPRADLRSELARSGDELTMRFAVAEGPRFRVRSATIAILDPDGAVLRRLDPAELPWWRQQPGAWYSADDWSDDIQTLWDSPAQAGGEVGEAFTHRTYDDATAEVDLAVELQLRR